MKHLLIIITLVLTLTYACKPDDIDVPSKDTFDATKMVVLNEGNFMWGNASMSLVDLKKDSIIVDDIYQNKNQEALGDVLQSATIMGHEIYIVINNSGKIVVLDKKTLVKKQEKSGLGSPRYVVDGQNGYLYVSDIYANHIKVLNKSDLSVHATIPCAGWTERMLYNNNRLYVCNKSSKQLYIVNTTSNSIIDSMNIGYGANSLLIDDTDHLWIASDGKAADGIDAKLIKCSVSVSGLSVLQSWSLNTDAVSSLCNNVAKDKIYYKQGESIYQMSSSASSLPSSAIITKSGAIWYGLGIEPSSGDVFVSDALDYVQRSSIYRYSADGSQLKAQYKAGIISNGFLFGE